MLVKWKAPKHPLNDKSINPFRLSSARSPRLPARYIHRSEFARQGPIADAAIILTSASKPVRIAKVEILATQDWVRAMRFEDYREAHRARVVQCVFLPRVSH